jgi:tRNA-dihydrouridine synthase A
VGCSAFIIHAHKAWLRGLSPTENPSVPPLRYDMVQRVKQDFPQLEIVLNGGTKTLDPARAHLAWADGVMFGREAYSNPYLLADVDRYSYADSHPAPSREQVLASFIPCLATPFAAGVPFTRIAPHIMGLFQGLPGACAWRRCLSDVARRHETVIEMIEQALRSEMTVAEGACAWLSWL